MSDSVIDEESPTVIGISFGNASSAIAYITKDGNVDCLANEDGDRAIPSTLSYNGPDEYHAAQAKGQMIRNARNTVTNFKDNIGLPFSALDQSRNVVTAQPVEVDGEVGYTVERSSGEEGAQVEKVSMTAAELGRRHFSRLHDSAKGYLGREITGAVLTVPTNASEAHISSLVSSAEQAGLKVLQVIRDPVAEALALSESAHDIPKDRLVVVADFGASRSDVSVLSFRSGLCSVLATAHDVALGGNNFDRVLVDHFAKEFNKKNKIDIHQDTRALAKLTAQSELTKKSLSAISSSNIAIDSLSQGIDFNSNINRLRFELLSRPLLDQMMDLVASAVRKANLDVLDIDEVLLAGGSSNIPKISSRVQAVFPEHTIVRSPSSSTGSTSLDPSELPALGAAFQASLIANYERSDVEQSSHAVVTNAAHLKSAIGIINNQSSDSPIHVLLASETALPARRTAVVSSAQKDGSSTITICEVQREIEVTKPQKEEPKVNGDDKLDDEDASDLSDLDEEPEEIRNKRFVKSKDLAQFTINGLEAGAEIEITLHADVSNRVTVTARPANNGKGDSVRGVIESSS